MRIEFFVPGDAKTQGSKSSFIHPHTGKVVIVDANPKTRKWRDVVSWYGQRAWNRRCLTGDPIRLILTFWRQRPKGDFRTRQGKPSKLIKDSAAAFPITQPDALKLARTIEDGLSKVIYNDDSQNVDLHIYKRFCRQGEQPGVNVVIETMDNSIHGHDYINDDSLREEPYLFDPQR